MTIRVILVCLAASIALAGCNKHRGYFKAPAKRVATSTHTPTPVRAPTTLFRSTGPSSAVIPVSSPSTSPYLLDSGDKLRITVFGQDNLSRTYPVDAGGYVSMPLIGAKKARGITTYELEEQIASALRRKYIKDPKVTVEIETYRPFFIHGEVRNGGQFPYVAGMTVETAVAIAGGYTPRARKRKMQLTRRKGHGMVTQMVPPAWKLQPGDTITVKERFF